MVQWTIDDSNYLQVSTDHMHSLHNNLTRCIASALGLLMFGLFTLYSLWLELCSRWSLKYTMVTCIAYLPGKVAD